MLVWDTKLPVAKCDLLDAQRSQLARRLTLVMPGKSTATTFPGRRPLHEILVFWVQGLRILQGKRGKVTLVLITPRSTWVYVR